MRPRRAPRRVPGQARTTALLLAPLLALAGAPAAAQQPATVEAATTLLQAERYGEAAEAFRAVTDREPENGIAWYRLGMALQEAGEHGAAIPPLRRAAELGYQARYARARIARAQAALGQAEAALETLEAAAAEGLDAPQLLEHADLASLEGDPRFRELVARVARNADPCAHTPAYHALDFWIGEWDVYDPAGQKVGENRIVPLLGSCALQENWRDARGSEGKSLNVYDRTTGLWRQLWVTDRGAVMDYSVGRVEDGAMAFEGAAVSPQGDTVHRRMVFTPLSPDSVRQEIFQSGAAGGPWTSAWIGIYVRRSAPEAPDDRGPG